MSTHNYNLRKRKKPMGKDEGHKKEHKEPNNKKQLGKHATVHIINLDVKSEQDKLKIHTNMTRTNKYNDDPTIQWFMQNCYQHDDKDIQIGNKSSFSLSIDDIKSHYPNLIPLMKRGDLVENIHESGYRSQGVYCYDGIELVSQEKRYDDYGNPSSNFKLIHEFPPGYWDKCQENNVCEPEHHSQFYWHMDQSFHTINLNDFDYSVKITNIKKIYIEMSFISVKMRYYQFSFTHKSKRYLVLMQHNQNINWDYKQFPNITIRHLKQSEFDKVSKKEEYPELHELCKYDYVLIDH